MSDLAGRLVKERVRLRLTSKQLSDLAGVTQGQQLDYEKGTQLPDADYLSKLAMQGADVLYLLTGQRTKPASAAAPDYQIDPAVAAHLPTAVIEDTIRVLHRKLWETADALSKISARGNSGQPRAPKDFIAEHMAASKEKAERLKAFLHKPDPTSQIGLN